MYNNDINDVYCAELQQVDFFSTWVKVVDKKNLLK